MHIYWDICLQEETGGKSLTVRETDALLALIVTSGDLKNFVTVSDMASFFDSDMDAKNEKKVEQMFLATWWWHLNVIS